MGVDDRSDDGAGEAVSDPVADPVQERQQATPVERVFMVQATEMRATLDKIGQTVLALNYLAGMATVLLAIVAYKAVTNGR